ncbi:cytochrome P450 [Mycena capillaripes]|nr:cytochrome P450 [Mycena capillaripes]
MFITLTQLLLWAIGIRLLSSLARSIHAAFFSPLSRIPGPWYMAMSDFWLSTHLMRFKQTSTIHELLRVYGPVLRVGPNRVAFCDLAGMRDVYLHYKFPKNPALYDNFRIMTFFENKSHATRRRAVGPHYTANVPSLQPEMHKITLQLLESLETIAGQQPVDCLQLLRSYMVDIVVFSSFGYELGGSSLFPNFVWSALSQIPNARWKRFTRATQTLKQFVAWRVREVQELHGGKESDAPTLVERLLQHKDSATQEGLALDSVVAETVAHLQALDVSQKLRAEIDAVMPDPRVIPDLAHLQDLPYLNAFIQEGIDICSFGSDFQLMQYTLPPGTVVGTQAWSVHRDPDVFPSPDIFNPERWLNDEANVSIRAAHTMPFGLGTRT